MRRVFSLFALLLTLGAAGPAPALAQDASPAASPAATCDAPALPPGTPTPIEEGTPAAEAEATPAVAEAAPPAPPAGTPAAAAEADEATAALQNAFDCINAGDYLAVAALLTDDFIQGFIEVPTPYDVPATFADVQPVTARSVGNAQTYADGRISVDVVYTGLFNGPGSLGSERWFFVEEDGVAKLDALQPVPLPEGILPGATIVDVRMVDYAFALDAYTLPANTPIILRTTNESGTGAPHVNVVLTYGAGTTAEGLIEGEVDLEASTGFFGALFLEPGATADLAFEALAPGTYFLVCDVTTEDGTPHHDLGMVTEITLE